MQIIKTPNMPVSNGHYSQCIEHNGILYLSGQLPIEKSTRNIPNTIEEQTILALQNAETILLESGSDKNHVIQVRLYISNINLWDQVNTAYIDFFQNHKPVRSVIPSRELHYGALIEVELLAIVKS